MAFTSNVGNSLISHPEVWAHMQAPPILLVSHDNLSSTCWHLLALCLRHFYDCQSLVCLH